jgi:hypothetical protein
MAWARLDDGWHDHPKTVAAGPEAAGVWVMCLTWAHKARRTSPRPGFVPKEIVARFAGTRAKRVAERLVEVRYFDPTDGGWMVHDFAQYLPKYDPAKASENGKKGAEKRWPKGDAGPPDEPPPDSEPPDDPASGLPSDRHANRQQTASQKMARAGTGGSARRNPVPVVTDEDLGTDSASVDAHEPEPPAQRTVAQQLAARYGTAVRLGDAGKALRTIAAAIDDDRISPELVANGVEVLIAEQRECTRGTLRVALLKAEGNWGPAAGAAKPGNPYLDDLRAAAAAAGDSDAPLLWAVPDPPALEAR